MARDLVVGIVGRTCGVALRIDRRDSIPVRVIPIGHPARLGQVAVRVIFEYCAAGAAAIGRLIHLYHAPRTVEMQGHDRRLRVLYRRDAVRYVVSERGGLLQPVSDGGDPIFTADLLVGEIERGAVALGNARQPVA